MKKTKQSLKTKQSSKTKKSKKISMLDLNTLFNNDVESKQLKKSKQQSKTLKTISTLKKQSLDYLQKIYHLDLYKNTIASFYTLNNPMITYLVSYNDSESKSLIRNGLSYLKLVSAYKIPEIEETLKMIDTSYKLNKDLLKELKLKDIPQIVQYASEDFTRGIRAFLDARYKHLPINISNGFVKLWEILHTFKLLEVTNHNSTNHKSTFKVFHICEAPGQMILCAEYYAKKKEPSITNYEWRANSLNPYNYEVKTKFGALKDNYKLMKNNPDKWLWGADNTGDITRVKNIKWFRNYINNKWLAKNDTMDTTMDTTTAKLDLIIGDGGIGTDTNSIYNLQKLDLAQVINVVACSSIGGSCVIKHFTSYMIDKPETIDATSFFISFIYLYYICFEDVSLFKPYTSDATSGEFYVIGKGFKGIEERDLEKLYTILNQFKVNYAIFPKEALPDTFIKQINNFLELMSHYNMKAYEKQNLLLKCYKEAKETKDKKHKKNNDNIENTSNSINSIIECNTFLNEDKIKEILVPRYNQWIKINEFE
jgi:hypothetical protein